MARLDLAFDLHTHFALVIWAIGWSMIVLAALVHLPVSSVTALGLALIVGHNAFDGIMSLPRRVGPAVANSSRRRRCFPRQFWPHARSRLPPDPVDWRHGRRLRLRPRAASCRSAAHLLLRLGLALTAAFVVLRFTNLYGDPRPWSVQPNALTTLYSFLHCHKYPPSLCYLLMTLGPALVLLGLLDRGTPRWMQPLFIFGRVPMFFYLLHIPLLHALAIVVAQLTWGRASWLYGTTPARPPADAGFGLIGVYFAWLVALGLLYVACRWFAAVERRQRSAWLSYL